jgi:predicted DNA-binding transcriptional regulator YafY
LSLCNGRVRGIYMRKNHINKQQTRPPLERMQRIFRIIKEGQYPSRIALAQEIEVTTKTIQRDIDFMRERLHLPIAHNREKNGYEFTVPVEAFPMLELNSAELVSVFVAQKALGQFRGTPFEMPLRSAFEKLTAGLKGSVSVPWSEVDSAISFRDFDFASPDMAVFQTVSEAVQKGRVLEFEYKKLNSLVPEPRRVEPYHLACILNQWYCFAFDLKRSSIRAFVLGRMRNPVMTPEEIGDPKPFSIDAYLKGSFRVFNAKGDYRVRILFNAFAAQLVRERSWHPSQKMQDTDDGGLELQLRLSSLEEVEPWILSWGQHVRVLAPEALRNRIYEAALFQVKIFTPGQKLSKRKLLK